MSKNFSAYPLLKRARFVLLCAAVFAFLTPGLGSLVDANAQAAIVINLGFEYLRQGTAGLVQVSGPDLAGGVATVFDRQFMFFPAGDGFATLLAVPMETRMRVEYPLHITLYQSTGAAVDWEGTLRVESGEFIREPEFIIPSDRLHLLRPDVQANEDLRLLSVYSVVTPERYWEGQFAYPASVPLASPFGSVRDYNDGSTRRHTGYDLRAPTGTPIQASASGHVVFARAMDIHGNIVIVDHGWGVFSSYAHLSEIYVVPGQRVLQGEVIGLSGNTGRSTGPHLHWEVAVNGIWVDGVEFATLRLPGG